MWSNLHNLITEKDIKGDEVTYEIKKFLRKKLDKAFRVYLEKERKYKDEDNNDKELSFKRAKVKFMVDDCGIDEYTAYHITELFDNTINYDSSKKVIFPKRGKNIPEDLLMKILGKMEIDANWFFIESMDSPVKFIESNNSSKSVDIKNEIIIPIYENLAQLTNPEPLTVSFSKSILSFLGLNYINLNEKHPIFQYYNFVFIKVKDTYYLTNLWDQDLRDDSIFLVYGKSNMLFEVLDDVDVKKRQQEVFILGKVLTSFQKLVKMV
jgi:hypothetical protein